MIRKNSEYSTKQMSALCGGKGDALREELFAPSEFEGKHVIVCTRMTLAPGAVCGSHPHDKEDEIYYILSGHGEVTEGDNAPVAVGPGDSTLTGHGLSHAIACTGDEPLVFLAVIVTC